MRENAWDTIGGTQLNRTEVGVGDKCPVAKGGSDAAHNTTIRRRASHI